MASSRLTRVGAAVLVSLIVGAVLTPAALGASPTVPTPTPGGSPAVAATRITANHTAKPKSAHAAAVPQAVPATSGYSIEGTVTAVGGGTLSSIEVEVDSTTSSNYYTSATALGGTYSVDGLPPDTYDVWFEDPTGTHFNGYYSGGGVPVDYSSATPVPVTNATVTGINAQLALVAPWTISIQASATSLATGSEVTITATANQDILLTNYDIYILRDDGTGWYCESGTTCYTTDSLSSPGSATYHAIVAAPPNATSIQATSSSVTVTWSGSPTGTPGTYHAITPTRVLDTRNGTGGLSGPFTNHAARTFQVTGGSSGVPANATAVTGNLTVTGQTSSGYLYIGPVANNNPTSSTLNFPVGDDRANAAIVQLGAGGTLSITFVAPSNGPTAQAIFDVTGYFTPDATGATYHAISPIRVLDTRNGTGGLSGPFTNHAARTFTVSGVPGNATAVTGNLTVTGQTSGGYLYIGPTPQANPTSSTLNFPQGDDRANAVTVQLGAGSLSITFVAPSNGPSAHAIFDVTGYFTPDMTGAVYVPLSPTRDLDTRNGTGGLSGPFTNHAARTFTLAGVPSNATAVTGNLTVTGQTSSGYLYIGPDALNNPTSSTLNFPLGDDRANAVAVAIGAGGALSVTFVGTSNGPTAQAIFDLTGYFAPAVG
jgi:hypothetical protein